MCLRAYVVILKSVKPQVKPPLSVGSIERQSSVKRTVATPPRAIHLVSFAFVATGALTPKKPAGTCADATPACAQASTATAAASMRSHLTPPSIWTPPCLAIVCEVAQIGIETFKWTRRASVMLAFAAALIAAAPAVATPRPNIVVIQTDDQTVGELTHASMPHVLSALAGHGTTFSNYIVASPQCCPSRASLITGDYPHNTGVLSNTPGYDDLVDKRNVLPAWLRRAGYRTIHVGKYLNGYESARPAPGWSRWFTEVSPLDYYDYTIAHGGRFVHFGNKPADYLARVLKRAAIRLVRQAAHAHKPFYLELDEHAPHGGGGGRGACSGHGLAVPGPADRSRFQGVPLPQEALPAGSRSLDEQNVSDKPSFMRALPRIDGATLDSMRKRYDCALAAIHSVDRSVGGLFSALRHAGLWSNTVVILTSDNGFFFGEHRLPQGKDLPYEEAIRQPLIIRVPRAYAPNQVARSRVAAANIDLAPTILKLAGATPCRAARHCRTLDGRSLLGPVKGRTGAFRGGISWSSSASRPASSPSILAQASAPSRRSGDRARCSAYIRASSRPTQATARRRK